MQHAQEEPPFMFEECSETLKSVVGHGEILKELLSVIGGLKRQSQWCPNLKQFVKKTILLYGLVLKLISYCFSKDSVHLFILRGVHKLH